MASTELGHHQKRVYISMDGSLVVPSSASIMVEPGGMLRRKASTGGLAPLYTTKPSTQISCRGVSILRTTDSVGPLTMAQPLVSQVGCEKLIIWQSSAKLKLRIATGAGIRDVRSMSSSASVIVMTSDLGKKAKTQKGAVFMSLRSLSTDRWLITAMSPAASTGAAAGIGFTFSSCT